MQGIDLVSLLWTDDDRLIPCDFRIYQDAKVATRNDHFRARIDVAYGLGFQPACVLFDGWYSSLENLKHLRSLGWRWLTRLKSNRLVNRDRQGTQPLSRTDIAASGTVVWLTGYGLVRVFKSVAQTATVHAGPAAT